MLPLLDSIFGITILTSKQLIPDSFQMTIEGTKNLIKPIYVPENSKQSPEQDISENLAQNQIFNEIQPKKDNNFDNKINQNPKYFTNSVLESSKHTPNRNV
ncbi:hypothetical protein NOVO_06645 [Rickettsiales bacterium Ac37b]|nr:hypothetical protein NOVO_06645 [Rickettsiales bacterium Ac37b]